MEQFAAQIRQLELKLLHTDMRANPSCIDELLADTFEEIGSNGQISSRQAVVEWLLNKDNDLNWSLEDFRIKLLSDNVVIAIYRAVKKNQLPQIHSEAQAGSIRSSIWQRRGDHWKMVFHQATKRI